MYCYRRWPREETDECVRWMSQMNAGRNETQHPLSTGLNGYWRMTNLKEDMHHLEPNLGVADFVETLGTSQMIKRDVMWLTVNSCWTESILLFLVKRLAMNVWTCSNWLLWKHKGSNQNAVIFVQTLLRKNRLRAKKLNIMQVKRKAWEHWYWEKTSSLKQNQTLKQLILDEKGCSGLLRSAMDWSWSKFLLKWWFKSIWPGFRLGCCGRTLNTVVWTNPHPSLRNYDLRDGQMLHPSTK